MCPEDSFEMTPVFARRAPGVDPKAPERRHRGRPFLGMPARNDAVEVVEVGREVQGETVADHRAAQLDPDGGHLLAIRPHAGEAGISRLGSDAQLSQVIDQRPLEHLQVLRDRDPKMCEVEDRVADQLAGAVIGCLTTPVGPDHLDLAPAAFSLVPKQMVRARGPAHRTRVGARAAAECPARGRLAQPPPARPGGPRPCGSRRYPASRLLRAGTCSSAWYEERTRGPASTCPKPMASAFCFSPTNSSGR